MALWCLQGSRLLSLCSAILSTWCPSSRPPLGQTLHTHYRQHWRGRVLPNGKTSFKETSRRSQIIHFVGWNSSYGYYYLQGWLGNVIFYLAYQCTHLKTKVLVITWKGRIDVRWVTSKVWHKKSENNLFFYLLWLIQEIKIYSEWLPGGAG